MGRSADLPRTAGERDGDDSGCSILHVDMDAFFASVEIRRNPDLAAEPVIVGGGRRGVVAAASYRAREYGVRSAMPMGQALRLCPHAVVLPPDRAAYSAASREVFAIFRDVTPLVEGLSLDEAFLDVSGAVHVAGRPATIARAIRQRVRRELGLTCSVGVASTKFVAKLASARCKPDGMLVVPAAGVRQFLDPLPVTALWGVGERTAQSLRRLGLRTVADLAATPVEAVRRAVGAGAGDHLVALARGEDARRVEPNQAEKSISAERTYAEDLTDADDVLRQLLALSAEVGRRLRAAGLVARTIAIKIRFADFRTLSRARTLGDGVDADAQVSQWAAQLYRSLDLGRPRIRLVGVRADHLMPAARAFRQMELDVGAPSADTPAHPSAAAGAAAARAADPALTIALDRARDRFGDAAVRPAALAIRTSPPAGGSSSRAGAPPRAGAASPSGAAPPRCSAVDRGARRIAVTEPTSRMAALVGRLGDAAARRSGRHVDSAVMQELLAVAGADHLGEPSAEAAALDSRIDGIARVFGIDDVDAQLLVAAAAPDIDATIAALYGALRGLDGPARLGVGLAQELAGLPTMSGQGMQRLGPAGALRRHGLLEVVERATWLSSEVAAPHRVVAHALGADAPERALAPFIVHPLPVELPETAVLARAIEAGAPLLWIRSPLGAAGLELAVGALHALGVAGVCVDLRRAPGGPVLHDLLRSAVREAGLLGQALVLGGAERLGTEGADALAVLSEAVVPVVAVSLAEWDSSWAARYPLTFDAPTLEPAQRDALWRRAASGAGGSGDPQAGASRQPRVDEGLAGLRLAPGAIVQTAQYARWLASARGEALSADIVRASARRVSGTAASISAVGEPRHGFDDLVLPDPVRDTLRQLVGWARHRDEMLAAGTLLQSRGKGSGLSALFTGSPGTGKTLAAHVIADVLGIDLVQVDLSAVVDKYIGETEKNLERVFHQAESLNVVLFFDEADALFGRRSEVKDSHDRHANQEVAYLLQRMESFDGITILATNLRGNLDAAFSRRMTFIVHFPDPDEPTRRRIWDAHIGRMGPLDPDDPIDIEHLAASVELAGGDIRNIVVAAAYDAVAGAERPGMRHLVRAARAEYRKLGRRLPAGEFAPPHSVPSGG